MKANERLLKQVDKTILKKVYLAGGEPTYIRRILTVLRRTICGQPGV